MPATFNITDHIKNGESIQFPPDFYLKSLRGHYGTLIRFNAERKRLFNRSGIYCSDSHNVGNEPYCMVVVNHTQARTISGRMNSRLARLPNPRRLNIHGDLEFDARQRLHQNIQDVVGDQVMRQQLQFEEVSTLPIGTDTSGISSPIAPHSIERRLVETQTPDGGYLQIMIFPNNKFKSKAVYSAGQYPARWLKISSLEHQAFQAIMDQWRFNYRPRGIHDAEAFRGNSTRISAVFQSLERDLEPPAGLVGAESLINAFAVPRQTRGNTTFIRWMRAQKETYELPIIYPVRTRRDF